MSSAETNGKDPKLDPIEAKLQDKKLQELAKSGSDQPVLTLVMLDLLQPEEEIKPEFFAGRKLDAYELITPLTPRQTAENKQRVEQARAMLAGIPVIRMIWNPSAESFAVTMRASDLERVAKHPTVAGIFLSHPQRALVAQQV
jgi:hypothetical protein